MQPVTPVVNPLRETFANQLQLFRERVPAEAARWLDLKLENLEFARQLQVVWDGSEFIATVCHRKPALLRELVESEELSSPASSAGYAQRLHASLASVDSDDGLHRALRLFREREMVRILWRDLAGLATLRDTTGDMTALADACIIAALNFLARATERSLGVPVGGASGTAQQLLVIAMGKLGAGELNLSSDVDLMFAYGEGGETQSEPGAASHARDRITNQEFFTRLGQKLIQALDTRTTDGFVFRVDMRLRPYGQSGPLVFSCGALEEYYQSQGRDWERYAMVKARVISGAGEPAAAARLMSVLRAFTYRKYIDFSVIQSLRDMKALINREVRRKALHDDIKRGAGGIREVEFIVQAFQLVRGGRDRRFQNPVLLEMLPLLAAEGSLTAKDATDLETAYGFLRNVEHRLQGWRDEQTQQLPRDAAGRARLARLLGFNSVEDFDLTLARHRQCVRDIFDDVVAQEDDAPDGDDDQREDLRRAQQVWSSRDADATPLVRLGFDPAEEALEILRGLRDSSAVKAMQSDARARMDALMPLLIGACARVENSVETLRRTLKLVESVARRSAYLVLLTENSGALEQLVRLCAASPWITAELCRHPALLDELLDPRTLYTPLDKTVLQRELQQQLLRIPEEDLDGQMEALRYFRSAQSLRIAACEVSGVVPLMKVSDYLTWLAEIILDYALVLAWKNLVDRHGQPGDVAPGEVPFLIIGYGKLGGIELGHSSDLDLVFIYDADPDLTTSGPREVSNGVFFARLGQRILHILGTRTPSGVLYEVDMRLRPSGNAGLLVTTFPAFAKYQQESAWIWEHQALVRARPVTGSQRLAEQFNGLRQTVLTQQRDPQELQLAVREMRARMLLEHVGIGADSEATSGMFDLKQARGGIVDIEFMVQFALLAQSHQHPGLTRWTDNIRLLDALAEFGVLSADEKVKLQDAYRDYRAAAHRLQLQQRPGLVPAEEFVAQRAVVCALWERLLGAL